MVAVMPLRPTVAIGFQGLLSRGSRSVQEVLAPPKAALNQPARVVP